MSAAELIEIAESLDSEERVFLAAYLRHLERADSPAYKAELTHLNQEIDDGKRFSLAQVKRLHKSIK